MMTEDLLAPLWIGTNSGSSAFFPNSQPPILDSLTISAPQSAAMPLLMQPDGLKISPMGAAGLALPDWSDLSSSNSNWGDVPTSIDSLIGTIFDSPLVQSFLAYHPLDKTPPQLKFGLLNDTGSSNKDQITNNPSIQGTAKDNIRLRGVEAQLDNGKSYSISSELNRGGKFVLDRDDIQRINGGMKLADGQHIIKITATDIFGNKTTNRLDFTLDTTAPTKATIALDVASDSGTIGDYRTNNDIVTLTGKTEANTQLKISQKDSATGFHTIGSVTSDANGNYQLTGVNLAKGTNSFS
jgi:Bacterial Ig-like domain